MPHDDRPCEKSSLPRCNRSQALRYCNGTGRHETSNAKVRDVEVDSLVTRASPSYTESGPGGSFAREHHLKGASGRSDV